MAGTVLPQKLTSEEGERLNTLRQIVRIEINGDWDETMIHSAFDELEKLFRVDDPVKEEGEEVAKPSSPPTRRRGRR